MKKEYILLFVFLFIVILIVGIFAIKKLKETKSEEQVAVIEDEYTPEEEISEEQSQERTTVVTVYFPNKETGKITPEARTVDVRDIVNNPYQKLMEFLIAGPTSDKLQKIIPENTIILGNSIEEDTVTLNLSKEILNYNQNTNQNEANIQAVNETNNTQKNQNLGATNAKENLITAIVNTMTELSEVNKVKIIVEGQTNEEFNQTYERLASE